MLAFTEADHVNFKLLELRTCVVLSLSCQIILYVFASRREYVPSQWIQAIVWSAYIMADWLAAFAVGLLSGRVSPNCNNMLSPMEVLWAPLLLMHLGGPDTITAYSLEDNRLWLRHFLSMLLQTCGTIYVVFRYSGPSIAWYVKVMALLVGIIKYGERSWVLVSVNRDRNGTIVPFNDRVPGYRIRKFAIDGLDTEQLASWCLFEFKKYVNWYDTDRTRFALPMPVDYREINIWELVETEMGLMYDLLYAKASLIHTYIGFFFRCLSFSFIFMLLLLFTIDLVNTSKKCGKCHQDFPVDTTITGVLLVGAVGLEIYGAILALSSDWMVIGQASRPTNAEVIHHYCKVKLPWPLKVFNQSTKRRRRRWSNMIGQINLFEFCISQGNPATATRKITSQLLQQTRRTRTRFPDDLPNMVVGFLRSLNSSIGEDEDDMRLMQDLVEKFRSIEFQNGIMVLHLVTEICCSKDQNLTAGGGARETVVNNPTSPAATTENGTNLEPPLDDDREIRETCKILPNYMMYLIYLRPELLPTVRTEIFQEVLKVLKSQFSSPLPVEFNSQHGNFDRYKVVDKILSCYKSTLSALYELEPEEVSHIITSTEEILCLVASYLSGDGNKIYGWDISSMQQRNARKMSILSSSDKEASLSPCSGSYFHSLPIYLVLTQRR
ncbi:hypothetical protein NMG60_11020408 [Bertholletia excelsa]